MFYLCCVLVYAGLYLVGGVFVFATVAAAKAAGITVQKCDFGVGPRLCRWNIRGIDYEFRPLPITAGVKMLGMEDFPASAEMPPGSFYAKSVMQRIFVSLAGPVAGVLVGLLMVCVPVALQAPQLSASSSVMKVIEPRAVPVLGLQDEPASWNQQVQLYRDTAAWYVFRLFTFRPLPGYGGYVGFIATTAAVALRSPVNALTCLGMLLFTQGVVGLLPIPSYGGGQAIFALWDGIVGRQRADHVQYYLLLLSSLLLLVIVARVVWLDVSWLIGLLAS